jgi:hypothetical protein
MRPAEHEGVPRLSEVVRRAVDVCDGPDDLFVRFEDRDEPITAIEDIETTMAEAVGALEPDETDPQLVMAAAVTVYLAHRRDEVGEDPVDILRLAARAEFKGHPPAHVANWLEQAGVPV